MRFVAVSIVMLLAMDARAAIFDFSAAYQGVTASYGGGVVTMSVFDEERLQTKTTNVASAATFDLTAVNGVVAWSSGSQIYYYIYDPTLGRWVGETGALGPTASDLRTANGIVVWSTTAGTIQYRVYDRQRGSWRAGNSGSGAASNLRAVDGTVAWSNSGPSGSAHARVYDPIKGSWQAADVLSIAVNDFVSSHGVVAFTTTTVPTRVYYYVYDPTRTGWQAGNVASGVPSDLRCDNGVVAWSVNPAVYFTVYDPSRGLWRNSSEPSTGYTADLAILNSVVTWTTASSSYVRGYDAIAGTWGAGPAVRLAYFAVSTNNANAPLLVHFIDMSIGGVAWSWNFGDNATSMLRSPTHRYTNLSVYVATETVAGSFGSASTNKLMATDVTPPGGTVIINGGATITTNPVVLLALNATDNSGTVATMRFSNTGGGSWSPWESYATSKFWLLATNDGVKNVYVQFADVVTNISGTASDSIQLDTSPLPIVSVLATNVAEGVGNAIVSVGLSTNYGRLVSVRYATSSGSATEGVDFMTATGRLDFPPGATVQTFSIPITQDSVVELNETISIVLSDPTNCIIGGSGLVSIIDDDLPFVSFGSTNFTASEGSSNAIVTVQLNAAFGQPVTVRLLATNGTATSGVDFVATNSVLTIPSGQTNAAFLVRILDDAVDEAAETITLRILGATNAIPAGLTNAILTLLDDDAPRVGFSQKVHRVFENDGFVMLNIQLSKPVAQQVEFDYLVFGGTATPGPSGDYLPDSNHRSFAPGSTNVIVFVTLVDNELAEFDETVHLSLSNITHADAGPNAEADILVLDDDGPPRLISPHWSGGLFSMTARGKSGQVFQVQTSTNLSSWATALLLTNQTGTLEFNNPIAPGVPRKFYRTRLP